MKKNLIIAFVCFAALGIAVYFGYNLLNDSNEMRIDIAILEVPTGNEKIVLHAPVIAYYTSDNDEEHLKVEDNINKISEKCDKLIKVLNDKYSSTNIECTYEVIDNKTIIKYFGAATDKSGKPRDFEEIQEFNFVLDAKVIQ